VYHSTLGLRVIKKKQSGVLSAAAAYVLNSRSSNSGFKVSGCQGFWFRVCESEALVSCLLSVEYTVAVVEEIKVSLGMDFWIEVVEPGIFCSITIINGSCQGS